MIIFSSLVFLLQIDIASLIIQATQRGNQKHNFYGGDFHSFILKKLITFNLFNVDHIIEHKWGSAALSFYHVSQVELWSQAFILISRAPHLFIYQHKFTELLHWADGVLGTAAGGQQDPMSAHTELILYSF